MKIENRYEEMRIIMEMDLELKKNTKADLEKRVTERESDLENTRHRT